MQLSQANDRGGPGHRPPPRNPELNLNFSEQPEYIREKLAEAAAKPRRVSHVIKPLILRVRELANKLLTTGFSVAELQALSRELAGVSQARHLICCTDVMLMRLIEKMEELTDASC